MDKSKRLEFFQNLLILTLLVGTILLSWLAGHILRFSIPALWHPPIRETYPQTKLDVEPAFDGIRRVVVLPGLALAPASLQIDIPAGNTSISSECAGLTYFTSLPAKCLTADGRLVNVQELEPSLILVPKEK